MENNKKFKIEETESLNKPGFLKRYLMSKMKRIYRRDKFELQKPLMKLLTLKWFMERDLVSFQQYKLLGNNFSILKENKVSLKYSFIKFYEKKLEENTKIYEKEGYWKYAVTFNKVRIIGSSDIVILDDKYALYDLKFLDVNCAFDYTDEAIKFIKKDTVVFETNKSDLDIEKGIYFIGNYSANYYHFIIEIISRFDELSRLDIDKNVPIIMDQSCWDIQQLRELITLFNVDNRDIIAVEKGVQYNVQSLYYLSTPNFIPPNYKNITNIRAEHNLFDIDSLNFIRKKLLENKQTVPFAKRIFISRKNASGRRQYNESEVYEILKRYGFSVFYPEEHSMLEQVAIFNQAEFIIGATGAAFTNLLFCNAGCKVICLTNYNLNVSIFCTISRIFEIKLLYMYDDSLELNQDSDVHIDFCISTNKLKKALDEILSDIKVV